MKIQFTKLKKIAFLFVLVVIFGGFSVRAQSPCAGLIIDAYTKQPLPFVNVTAKGFSIGTATDLDGRFKLKIPPETEKITLSYVGYEKLELPVWSGFDTVEMKPKSFELKEVVILPGKNPADSIIELAVQHRKYNNPKNYDQFAYEIYNKVLFTVDDSAAHKLMNHEDTSNHEFGKHLSEHELFMMETYSQNIYKKPGRMQENVIANRVSGLKNPSFYFLATLIQPFSFYESQIDLSGKKYLNPISRNSNKDYLFILKDTLYRGDDTVFVISYQPKKDRYFKALKGFVSINTDGYAIENVVAETALDKVSPLQIKQRYDKVNGKWFPRQLNFDIEFAEVVVNDYPVILQGRSQVRNVVFDTNLRRRDFSAVTTRLDKNANKQPEENWKNFRGDSLGSKEANTYTFMDSVGEDAKLDQKLLLFESLAKQSIPIKFLDLDLNSLFRYNLYEGSRLGAGLYTNHKVSRVFSAGGYFAYGFKDKTSKYGGRLDITLREINRVRLRLKYANDVHTPGYQDFERRKASLFDTDLVPFFVTWMNRVEDMTAEFTFPAMRYGRFTVFGRQRGLAVTNNYRFFNQIEPAGNYVRAGAYNTTEAGVNFRYSFAEEKAEVFNTVMTTNTPNPVFNLGYTFGSAGFPEGYDDYHKFRARISHSMLSQRMKHTSFHIEGSYVHGVVPLTEQFGVRSAFAPKIPAQGVNAFQTVRFGHFFSDLLFQGFFQHELIKFRTSKPKFSPSLTLFQAAAWGVNTTDDRPPEAGWKTQTPEHGLFESGLLIENIYKSSPDSFFPAGYGLGFTYRYGAYNKGPFIDNFAVNLVISNW